MSGLHGPGTGGPQDPYERIQSHEIQKDPSEEELSSKSLPKEKSPAALMGILHLIKKFVDLFSGYSKKDRLIFKKSLSEDFAQLSLLINDLKTQNLGQDLQFLLRLSTQWKRVIHLSEKIKLEEDLFIEIRKLVSSIEHYPKGKDFSLGYYLNQESGQEWVPFPWMELLTDLHNEHVKNPTKSHLHIWFEMIEKILEKVSS